MAFPTQRSLERRSSTSAPTVTTVVVVLIVLVVFAAFVRSCTIPKWLKRCRPSSTRFNGRGRWAARYGNGRPDSLLPSYRSSATLSHAPRRFPAHPGVMARSDKVEPRQRGAVTMYDPRVETPFANNPPDGEQVSLACFTSKPGISTANLEGGVGSTYSPSPNKPPRVMTRCGNDLAEGTEMITYNSGRRCGEAERSMLAMPEPLALKSRAAGRAPPLTKQLAKFPMPRSLSHCSSDEMHPNKIFAKLEEASRRGLSNDPSENTKLQLARASTLSDITSEASSVYTEARAYGESRKQLPVSQSKLLKPFQGDLTTGSGPAVNRRGTLTRPKTPVAEYRELYERAAAEARSQPFGSVNLKRESSPSTRATAFSPPPFSVVRSASTPPTSVKVPDKHLSLLPTPLRLGREPSTSFGSPTPDQHYDRASITPSSAALPESPDRLGPLRKNVHSKRPHRRSVGFYHRNRKPRPTALDLTETFRALSPERAASGKLDATKPDRLAPNMDSNALNTRMSLAQGSSRYSRDTKGISIARTPISPDFPTPVRSEFGIPTYAEQLPRRKSLDLIRSKIDGWNLHTEDMQLDPNEHAPIASPKRIHNSHDPGPRSPSGVIQLEGSSIGDITDTVSSHRRPSVPRIRVGNENDDVFSDEHERPPTRGKQRLRAPESAFSTWTTSQSNASSLMGRNAPANAEWI